MSLDSETTRQRNAAATRDAILRAARARFLKDSYESVGLRDIAGDVGVDVALVGRYFGGKEELFRQVIKRGTHGNLSDFSKSASLPEFLADLATGPQGAGDREHVEQLILILRSASSPTAAGIVRDAFDKGVLAPITRHLHGSDAELRASVSLAVLIGTTILNTIMSVGPVCKCDREPLRRRLIKVIEAALTDD